MASEAPESVGRRLQQLFAVGSAVGLVDGQLLERLATGRGAAAEAAFETILNRHGSMVLATCRRVLGDHHAAEDAFQATFLVLVRRAGSLRLSNSLGPWLHGVAARTALKARTGAARRQAREREFAVPEASGACEAGGDDLGAALQAEVARLPAKYRAPIVLCYLEGLTHEQTAERLGWPVGTVRGRLARARDLLRARLTRRGLSLPVGLLTAALSPQPVSAAIPAVLRDSTIRAAMHFAAGKTMTTGLIPVAVVTLAEGTLRAMWWTKMSTAGVVGSALAALVIGAGVSLAYQETKQAGRVTRSQTALEESPTPVVRTPGAAKLADPSETFIVPLPARGELHRLLRRAADEAVALAKAKPRPTWPTLPTIASVQAKTGDLDGARTTFAEAAREAEGRFGGAADAPRLAWVGYYQAESGLKGEACATLLHAFKALPGVTGDFDKDHQTVRTLETISQVQAGIGAREDARMTVDRLLEFSKEFLESTEIGNARAVTAPKIAAALAAVGDFEAAFRWSEAVENGGDVLGAIAAAASKALDREAARRYVREAADRLAKLETADQTYSGLSDLAEAQARLGDVEAAKRSARAIGEGPSQSDDDKTDGQPYALLRVATIQRQAGDIAGARETLRDGFRSVSDHPRMRGRDGRFAQIADGQIAIGDIDGAMRSVEAMAGAGPRSESLASIARAQAALGENDAARVTFARALGDAGLAVMNPPRPNIELANVPGVIQDMSAVSRMKLAKIQAMAGDIPGALKTVRSIDDKDCQRFALVNVVVARASAGDVAEALRLGLDESRTPEERRGALEWLGRGVDARLSDQWLDPRAQ